ncbi:MAG TPA: MFS transporter [Tepidisphaeraceae bacterium]|jgi:MFS family permease|nr:MFS transporter [Tepidisphaeraceae bacterium]
MALVTVAWLFGSVWVTTTSGAPLTMFAQALHLSRFEFGVLSALPFLASLLSLPASVLIERTGARKLIFQVGLYGQRLLWFPIALVPIWLLSQYGGKAQGLAIGLFLVLVLLMHCGQAVGGPAWMSWMADIVPDRVRGRYFSRRRQLGIFSALPAALLVGWVLDRYASGGNANDATVMSVCAKIFIVAAIFGLLDIVLFHWVPAVPKAPKRGAHLFQALSRPLRDRNFLWFAGFVATLTFAVSFMGTFVTLYVIEEAKVSGKGTQLMLLVAPLAAQLLVLPLWGRAVDRMGKKPVLKLSTLGFAPVAVGWCFMHSGNVWLGYVLSALGAAFWTGVEIANFNFVMQMAGGGDDDTANNRGTSYVAVNAVIVNIAGCMGGLASGAIAELMKDTTFQPFAFIRALNYYDVLFLLSFALRVMAVVVFLPHLHEPTAKRGREALRFMTINVYSNLYNLVLQPVRLVRSGGKGKRKDD